MSGSSNFLQFDSNAANMLTDSDYAASSAILNGVSPGIASATLHNKLFYQASTMVSAIGTALANLGYTVADNNISGLITALQTQLAGGLPKLYRSGAHPTWTSVASVTIPSGYVCRDDSNATDIIVGTNLVVSLAASGSLGLDTGAEASNTFYYLWLCKGGSGVTAVFSTSTTAPTLPTGYSSYKRRIPGAWRNDGSSNLISQTMTGNIYYPTVTYNVDWGMDSSAGTSNVVNLSASIPTSYTNIDLSAWLPSDAQMASVKVDSFGNSHSLYLRTNGVSVDMWRITGTNTNTYLYGQQLLPTDGSRLIQYKTAGTINRIGIAVTGYQVTGVS